MGLEAISTEGMREKLENLRDYMPGEDKTIYEFGGFLASRLNQEELAPIGFNVTSELALYDLQAGVDGFSQQPIRNGLVGYPTVIYAMLKMRIPDIAKAVCPEDFAREVWEVNEQTKAMLNEKFPIID